MGGSVVDNLTYTNTTIDNSLDSAQDKTYTFDPLGELLTATEGETETTYTYDSFGNASSANEANELSSQGYNSGGETTENTSGNVQIYDAWGRLVKIEVSSEDSAVIASYTYNGLNEMVTETVPSGGGTQTTTFIYSSQMQILEERIGGTIQSQYLWGADYVNDLILIKTAPSGGQTRWVQHDANYDVISVALQNDDSIGESTVENRYDYSAFGQVTLENASFEVVDSTSYYVDMLFQGMRFDLATGLYNTNERWYNPALDVFITRDPLGLGGDAVNEYRFVGNNPTSGFDPFGCSGGEIPTGTDMDFAPSVTDEDEELYSSFMVNDDPDPGSVPPENKSVGTNPYPPFDQPTAFEKIRKLPPRTPETLAPPPKNPPPLVPLGDEDKIDDLYPPVNQPTGVENVFPQPPPPPLDYTTKPEGYDTTSPFGRAWFEPSGSSWFNDHFGSGKLTNGYNGPEGGSSNTYVGGYKIHVWGGYIIIGASYGTPSSKSTAGPLGTLAPGALYQTEDDGNTDGK